MPKHTTAADRDLLGELGVDTAPAKVKKLSPKEERIIAGFEEIERFVEEHGRSPQHGEDRDIFERLYAVRLDRLRESEECRAVLAELDSQGLLDAEVDAGGFCTTPQKGIVHSKTSETHAAIATLAARHHP